ncbi:hypothetical protein GCM10028809_48510 [Spirosoma gilvum]
MFHSIIVPGNVFVSHFQNTGKGFTTVADGVLTGNEADWIDATLRLSPEAYTCYTNPATTTAILDSLSIQVWDEAMISVFE